MKIVNRFFLIVLVPALLLATGCGQSETESESRQVETSSNTEQQTMSQAPPSEKINLNTGSEKDFLALPGVGDNMVHEFEEYRPYVSIQQFRKEIGKYVDSAQVAAYEQYVFVPINPNECDAATLQQIPGLEASEADQLISARPFDSNDAFLQQLSEFVNEEQLATAKRYLAAQ